jgi:hypothetical protein
MFEKSKSALSFKEFQSKMNMINNFENDWGHFYDPDFGDSNMNNNHNILFHHNLHRPKRDLKKIKQIQIEKQKQKSFIDLEKQNKPVIKKEMEEREEKYIYEEESKTINIIETILNYSQTVLITIAMGYFIFKII